VTPATSVASALHWLGRGQSFRALAREIAWIAVRAAGGDQGDLECLSPLVEVQLGERFDQLPVLVREAALRAELDHLSAWPHDREGAALVGELAAQDAAVEHLSIGYMDVLDWAVGVLRARQASAQNRARRRRRYVDDPPVMCEVPQRILEGLARHSDQPGWRDHRAA
jgi:hypothetical protein